MAVGVLLSVWEGLFVYLPVFGLDQGAMRGAEICRSMKSWHSGRFVISLFYGMTAKVLPPIVYCIFGSVP